MKQDSKAHKKTKVKAVKKRKPAFDVFCSFQQEGWHYWKEAAGKYAYLGKSHRHMFHVTVTVGEHQSRSIEFIELRAEAAKAFHNFGDGHERLTGRVDFKSQSCEDLADRLADLLVLRHGFRSIMVKVSEDGENGAIVSYV